MTISLRPSLQNLFCPRNQRFIQVEYLTDVAFEFRAVERVDVELRFRSVGEKFRILHRLDERFAEDLHATLRRPPGKTRRPRRRTHAVSPRAARSLRWLGVG